jgi:hypothetical protein
MTRLLSSRHLAPADSPCEEIRADGKYPQDAFGLLAESRQFRCLAVLLAGEEHMARQAEHPPAVLYPLKPDRA